MVQVPGIPARKSSLHPSSSVSPEDAGPSTWAAPETSSPHRAEQLRTPKAIVGHESAAKSGQEAVRAQQSLPHPTGLAAQRQGLVDEIVQERHQGRVVPDLDDAGRAVFAQAGFEDRVGRRSDIEVKTKWLPPVIQEHVRPIVHTIRRTEVTRDIHKHHVYPKVQPIFDPDPIVLPTRHRFFSPVDRHWHEVIGDEAAIAILGEDVFLYGPKITRLDRRLADASEAGTPTPSQSRIIEREREGDNDRDWTVVQGETTTDEGVLKHGKLRDGMTDMTEGVRTLHLEI